VPSSFSTSKVSVSSVLVALRSAISIGPVSRWLDSRLMLVLT